MRCPYCGEINSIDEAFASPQVEHLGLAQDVFSQERGPTQLVGQPITLSRTESSIRRPPPRRGEHTQEILEELGYAADAIAAMRDDGVI